MATQPLVFAGFASASCAIGSLRRWIDQDARRIGMAAQEIAGRHPSQAAGVEHSPCLGDEVDEVIAAAILDGFDAAGNPALSLPIEDEIIGTDRTAARVPMSPWRKPRSGMPGPPTIAESPSTR